MERSRTRGGLTKYQKINVLLIFFFGGAMVVDAFGYLLYNHKTILEILLSPTIIGVGIPTVLAIVLFLAPEKNAGKYIQVSVLIVEGLIYIMSLRDVAAGGETIIAIGTFLLLKYGLLDRGRWIKIGVIGALTLGALVAGNLIHHNEFSNFLSGVILVAVVVMFLWLVFEEDLRNATAERDALRNQMAVDMPFVEFGKNTAGLAHDLKNDLNLASAATKELKAQRDSNDAPDMNKLDRLEDVVARISRRIDLVRYVTTAPSHTEQEILDLNMLTESAIYIFRVDPKFGKQIVFQFKPTAEPTYLGSRAKILSVVEDVLRTSCTSVAELPPRGELPVIRAEIERAGERASITVQDTGPGLEYCFDCESENCIECIDARLNGPAPLDGPSTELMRVGRNVKELGGMLEIRTRPGLGTWIRVTL